MKRLLVVEDNEKIRANLLFQLREEGFSVEGVSTAEQAWARLQPNNTPSDLLLLDVRLGGMSGVELVKRLTETGRLLPTIIISGEASISETVEALRLGVHDFIEKPFSKERLLQSVRNCLEHTDLKRQVALLHSQFRQDAEILGRSPAIEALKAAIAKVAATDARVLIRGESGTGKELVANTLRRQSNRGNKPFVKINCAAIPTNLIEDELFGHVRGAFTDARSAKLGLFEVADGGTLFLDEIADMDYPLQARLLRILEDGKVRRVGDTTDRKVDVRVIAATNQNLERMVETNAFREDLYFRLSALPIDVPTLRERPEDIPLLFQHFIESFCLQHQVRRREVDSEVFPALARYDWPGNVRELRNVCERLVIFGGDPITLEQLPSSLFQNLRRAETAIVRFEQIPSPMPLKEFKAQCEKEYIESVLRKTNWNFSLAAKLLAIQRTYLHQKVSTLGIERPSGSRNAMTETTGGS